MSLVSPSYSLLGIPCFKYGFRVISQNPIKKTQKNVNIPESYDASKYLNHYIIAPKATISVTTDASKYLKLFKIRTQACKVSM